MRVSMMSMCVCMGAVVCVWSFSKATWRVKRMYATEEERKRDRETGREGASQAKKGEERVCGRGREEERDRERERARAREKRRERKKVRQRKRKERLWEREGERERERERERKNVMRAPESCQLHDISYLFSKSFPYSMCVSV